MEGGVGLGFAEDFFGGFQNDLGYDGADNEQNDGSQQFGEGKASKQLFESGLGGVGFAGKGADDFGGEFGCRHDLFSLSNYPYSLISSSGVSSAESVSVFHKQHFFKNLLTLVVLFYLVS